MSDNDKKYIFIFLIAALIVAALSVLVPLGFYICNFSGSSLSSNPDDWASFGDYLGGTVNTLFSILNFAAVIGLAFIIYKLETKREIGIQSISLKPFVEVYNELKSGRLSIKLKNVGNGPAKITRIEIVKDSEIHIDLISILPGRPNNNMVFEGTTVDPGTYLRAGDEIELLLISGDPAANKDLVPYLERVIEILSEAEIIVSYDDIFNQETKKRYDLKPFGRWSE